MTRIVLAILKKKSKRDIKVSTEIVFNALYLPIHAVTTRADSTFIGKKLSENLVKQKDKRRVNKVPKEKLFKKDKDD